ncbi:MAG: hypothetical protein KGZ97_02745 [Bacteroidetes bacterium]|nr:hypothetical protein [Bacteroidota bacterium]
MRKILLAVAIVTISSVASIAQKAEVLYFKANLACCPARACSELEGEVKQIIESNFSADKVTFKAVMISDEQNKDLVEKHNAKSQTVVIVAKKKKNETVIDVSDIIRDYNRNKSKEELKTKLIAKINDSLK